MCLHVLQYLFYNTITYYFIAEGLAWDWVNEMLYWSDACNDDIEVYDPKTGYRRELIHTGSTSNPRQIVLDPINRYYNYYYIPSSNPLFCHYEVIYGVINMKNSGPQWSLS